MMHRTTFLFFTVALIALLVMVAMKLTYKTTVYGSDHGKINGVNFVAPKNEIDESELKSIHTINAKWIAIIPYAYTPKNSSEVLFYHNNAHWWGEGIKGAISQVIMAKNQGLKVMLKPHVWVIGEGWTGGFECENELTWKIWEESYRKYVLSCAKMCDSLDIDLFCFSTEYCKAVKTRSKFWNDLITDIKKIYKGPLTYAANWDNYNNVGFWDQMDYIGIDAYFPLSETNNPPVELLIEKWEKIGLELANYSSEKNKKILFTEFGYRSCDFTAKEPWKSYSDQGVNLNAQEIAFSALFQSVWQKDWMQGGFVWKWHSNHLNAGGSTNSRYTPQNKPAQAVIKRHYSFNNN